MDSFKAFADKWFTPVTLSCILGGVIWGVQINISIINLTKTVAAQQLKVESINADHREYELSIARATIIQQEMLKRLEHLQEVVDDHNREAAEWKRKIIRNEEAIRNGLER